MEYASLAANLGIIGLVRGRELQARCPFHDDRSPSFSLNVETGLYICFRGCGQGTFLQLVERVLDYKPEQARQWLAQRGKVLSVEATSRALAERLGLSPGHTPIAPEAMSDWQPYYESCSPSTMALWFLQRGFTWDTIQDWGIRYDANGQAVVIPCDGKGLIIRNLVENQPKYLYSRGLKRSEYLFGLGRVKGGAEGIILVEGPLDAIWLHQLGYRAAAVLGSHASVGQIAILKSRRIINVELAFDNDEAGIQGTKTTINLLTQSGWNLQQIKIWRLPPERKDVQECSLEEISNIKTEGVLNWA